MLLIALAVGLVLVLRERRRVFITAQVELLQSDDSQEATAARQRLQRIGRSAVRPVCALLEHEDEEVRARAALTLANIGHAAACGPLMEAAKRGDFPAADALEFMKHPRAKEAKAWVYVRLGDKEFRELCLSLPTGGRSPTARCMDWGPPLAPFETAWVIPRNWPDQYPYGSDGAHEQRCMSCPAQLVLGIQSTPLSADAYYGWALEQHPLAAAFIGRARVRELWGEYAVAAALYHRALQAAPGRAWAASGLTRAERLASLAEAVAKLVPKGYGIQRIVTHPTWREADGVYFAALVEPMPAAEASRSPSPRLVVFRQRAGHLETVGLVEVNTGTGVKHGGPREAAYADVITECRGATASVLLICATRTGIEWRYEMSLWRLRRGALVRTLRLPSATLPWAGDLDGDGDAEMVTWRWATWCPTLWSAVPWPTVRTLVGERYQVRNEQFQSFFGPVARGLEYEEGCSPLDPYLPEYAGRAYEILDDRQRAVAAYARAERKHLYFARPDVGDADWHGSPKSWHRKAAARLRQRRLRLEAAGAVSHSRSAPSGAAGGTG